ncbi:MAG: 50S ribosomal protein L15 [Acidimicrobiales bacterium]|jgi:large subunit ribosomal protein L15
MKLDDLAPAPGSRRPRRRVGRGTGGKGGKTAGRGTKGQLARNKVNAGFEGGQLPLTQRIPKLRGFQNPFRVEYNVVNLDDLEQLGLDAVTPDVLRASGVVHEKGLVKVLGRGSVLRAIAVEAHAFSRSAARAIAAAGGSATVVAPPHGDRRPPVRGNALANR